MLSELGVEGFSAALTIETGADWIPRSSRDLVASRKEVLADGRRGDGMQYILSGCAAQAPVGRSPETFFWVTAAMMLGVRFCEAIVHPAPILSHGRDNACDYTYTGGNAHPRSTFPEIASISSLESVTTALHPIAGSRLGARFGRRKPQRPHA